MKAFFRRIRLAEVQDVLVSGKFRPKVDEKPQRRGPSLTSGPALVPQVQWQQPP